MMKHAPVRTLLWQQLSRTVGESQTEELFHTLKIAPELFATEADSTRTPRAVLAQAMNMILFRKLVDNVPEGRKYVSNKLAGGSKVVFDHGAVRTVAGINCGALPSGKASVTRILEPLGFESVATYPLQRLKMTGYAYCHSELPEDISQFFVSELDSALFSEKFCGAADRVLQGSRDPLSDATKSQLDLLMREKEMDSAAVPALLSDLARAFDRQHPSPSKEDYDILKAESDEMAWIATEGTFFNHLTDRVDDVKTLADELRATGQPIKETVEVSRDKTVLQTAYRATLVNRFMRLADGSLAAFKVPGSFVEFITRHQCIDNPSKMDLRFDSSNAQGIFKMTTAAA
eukprot:TRINITY_DN21024_c2_g1_i1.p1 TRINITY_DN21024_c2_g1~~TRINITY_DN21024_c2_g1_i1.p1  ORF type:complete len:361 (+),score=150.64 TRINITY_DN21024_c2_g1_i1:47-1084(+)